jgi:hypothetical protein
MGHVKALKKTNCKYPVRRVEVEVKVDTVLTGNMNYVQDNMFLGQLPKRLVIACGICLDKTDPNIVFPSFVPTCLGPSIFSLP